jgi:hypothetical protein
MVKRGPASMSTPRLVGVPAQPAVDREPAVVGAEVSVA